MERLFRKATGRPPGEYLADYRMFCAARMLRESDLPIARIAHQTSFSDHAYFTRSFREKFGFFSSEYRKKIKLTQYLYKMSYFYIFSLFFVV